MSGVEWSAFVAEAGVCHLPSMQNMKKRLSGELEVSTSVRYADVPAATQKRSYKAAAGSSNQGASTSGRGGPTLPKQLQGKMMPGRMIVGLNPRSNVLSFLCYEVSM
jgi:hypothetical protein